MPVWIEVARHVARVVVMLAGNFLLTRLVAVTVRVEIAGSVPGMVVVLTRLLVRHLSFPF